jgi:hypothetical protein
MFSMFLFSYFCHINNQWFYVFKLQNIKQENANQKIKIITNEDK